MKTIAIFGEGVASISQVVTSQRRLNCLWDIRKDGDKSVAILIGTPGQKIWTSLPTAPIRGWHVVNNILYVVAGNQFYEVTQNGSVTIIGTGVLADGLTKVEMADNNVQLGIVDGAQLYCYTIRDHSRSFSSQIGNYADPAFNYPGSFGPVTDYLTQVVRGSNTIDFINGCVVVDRIGSRQFYKSASYDITNWGGYSIATGYNVTYATKENYSDNLQAVDVFNGMIILWGDYSIEFWQDVGTFPLPYSRIQGATQKHGLAALWSRAVAANTMYFLGKSPDGLIQVYALNGYVPTPISTSDIDDLLEDIFENSGTYNDAVALTYTSYGHVIYQLTFPTANRTIAYDTKTQVWHEAQTGLAPGRNQAELGIVFNGNKYASDSVNGNIYTFDDEAYTDAGTPIVRQVVSKHLRNQGNDLHLGDVFLDMETGVGLPSGQGSDPQISMEISKDGGRTFGIPRYRPVGKLGAYMTRVLWRRNGSGRDIVLRFAMTDPVKFVIASASLDVESGDA